MLNLQQYSQEQQQQQPSRNKRTKSITQNSLNKNKKLRRRTSSIYSNKAMITTTTTTATESTTETTETTTSPIPSNSSSSSPSSCKHNTPKNNKKMQTESKKEKFKLPPLNYPFSSSLSMIHQRKATSLLRTQDKTKIVAKKLQTLVALAKPSATTITNQQLALVRPPHNHSLAIAQVMSIFNQETATIKSFEAYQDHIQQVNDQDNQTRFQYARQRNQPFVSFQHHQQQPTPSTRTSLWSDFPNSLLRTRTATLETPRPPEPTLPSYESIQKRQKFLDDTFGQSKKPKRRKWRTSLEDEKLAFVQKILQQPGKISDMPGAYCEAHDIRKLRPRQWINDEIVTFYSVMINNRSSEFETHPQNFPPNEKFVKAYCFSSFFMAKYDKAGYDGVKRWSKKVDLLKKDVIIFPINISNAHWTCASINLRCKRFEYFDSMGNRNQSVLATLRDYIVNEARIKKDIVLDISAWPDCFYQDIPQQNNSFDCGVFVCQFMDCLSRDWTNSSSTTTTSNNINNESDLNSRPPAKERETQFDFCQENMEYIRSKMVYEIASKEFLTEEWI
ncbi:Smt3-specific protease [Puccinia graminis f. sp. tritici]|uniref:Smt3-specific protease n=1 Tax=Puccinia graminis f. sp. tritici TaxID=56615 RepID=A0A5B0R2T5_PUCGR|nr:Smt3-specific protease [Puccinia graminis f. sp. tritici]